VARFFALTSSPMMMSNVRMAKVIVPRKSSANKTAHEVAHRVARKRGGMTYVEERGSYGYYETEPASGWGELSYCALLAVPWVGYY